MAVNVTLAHLQRLAPNARSYRMRFIYARVPGECVLMGQEVLEFASL